MITINWGTFIWAVSNGHVLQTSLGYYINPLVSVLLAFIFLKERFNKFETLAIISRNWRYLHDNEDRRISNYFFNVGILIWNLWFTKKLVRVEAMSGIAIECIVTAPAGLIYIIYLWQAHQSSVGLNMSTFYSYSLER